MQQAESSGDTVQLRKNSCLRDAFMFFLWHTSKRQPIAVIGGRCRSTADNLQRGTVEAIQSLSPSCTSSLSTAVCHRICPNSGSAQLPHSKAPLNNAACLAVGNVECHLLTSGCGTYGCHLPRPESPTDKKEQLPVCMKLILNRRTNTKAANVHEKQNNHYILYY